MNNKEKKDKRHVVGYPDKDTLIQVTAYTQRTGKSESSLIGRLLSEYFRKNPERIDTIKSMV